MNRSLLPTLTLLLCASALAQYSPTTNRASSRTNLPGVTGYTRVGENRVVTDTTGLIIWPTNFWSVNSNALNDTVGELAGNTSASSLTSGTLDDARLTDNVVLRSNLVGSGIEIVRYDADGLVGLAFVGESGDTNLVLHYGAGVPPRFPNGLVGALNSSNLTGIIDEARIPANITRSPATNYVWLQPYDGRDSSVNAVVTMSSNFYGATLLSTASLGTAYDFAPAYWTTVSSSGNRFQRWPFQWLPGYSHFRLSGYWASTNSDNSILLWRRITGWQGGGASVQSTVSTAFDYSSTTTNLVADVAVFDFTSPTTGPVVLEYGLQTSHNLEVTLWLLALKLEYW